MNGIDLSFVYEFFFNLCSGPLYSLNSYMNFVKC